MKGNSRKLNCSVRLLAETSEPYNDAIEDRSVTGSWRNHCSFTVSLIIVPMIAMLTVMISRSDIWRGHYRFVAKCDAGDLGSFAYFVRHMCTDWTGYGSRGESEKHHKIAPCPPPRATPY